MQPGFEGDQHIEAIQSIREFVEARNLDEKIEYLRMHSFLLTDDALRLFDEVRSIVAESGDDDFAETIRSHRGIVEEVRRLGFEKAREELHVFLLIETVKEFMDGYSWMDSYIYLQKHPLLLSNDARGVLLAFGKKAHDEGDKEAEKVAIAHYNLLGRVEKIGAEAAFIEVGGEDFRAALRRSTK